jgi:glutamine phosphoribosylpyrophosphate amidotransferase
MSLEQMLNAMPKDNGQEYCTACFSGEYPLQIEEEQLKERNEQI